MSYSFEEFFQDALNTLVSIDNSNPGLFKKEKKREKFVPIQMTPRAPVVHRKHKYVATDKSEIQQAMPGALCAITFVIYSPCRVCVVLSSPWVINISLTK